MTADALKLVPKGTHIERARIRGAMERLLDIVGFSGAMSEVERARAEFLTDHRAEADADGWVG